MVNEDKEAHVTNVFLCSKIFYNTHYASTRRDPTIETPLRATLSLHSRFPLTICLKAITVTLLQTTKSAAYVCIVLRDISAGMMYTTFLFSNTGAAV